MSLVMSRVRAIVREEGFAINEAKGRVQRAKSGGLATQNRDGHQNFEAFLRGTIRRRPHR